MKPSALVLTFLTGAFAVSAAGVVAVTNAHAGDESYANVLVTPAPAKTLLEQKPPAPVLPELGDLPPSGEIAIAETAAATRTIVPAPAVASPTVASPAVSSPVVRDYPAPAPGSFVSPVAPRVAAPVRAPVAEGVALPSGWESHREGQVVWSSEWGTAMGAAAPANVRRAPAAVLPRMPSAAAPAPGLPFPEDTSAPSAEAPSSGEAPAGVDRSTVQAARRAELVRSYLQGARDALRVADVDGAKDLLTKALDLDPTNAEARSLWQSVSLDRASTSGAYAGSRGELATVQRERAATEVRNHLRRGQQNEAAERFEDAVRDYNKALSIISWYDQTADFGTSAENIRDLIDAAQSRSRVAERRARQDAIRRAQEEREGELVQAREQRLGRIRSWFEGAHRAFRRGEYALAREFARQILRADPNNRDAERIIEMSHDAEHIDNECNFRDEFAHQWKSIMADLEESALPQIDVVVFPENWLEDIAQRQPRSVGEPMEAGETADSVALMSVLEKSRVQGLTWEEANLNTIVGYLRTITGLNFHVSSKAYEEKGEEVSVNLNVSDVNVATILDLVTQPYDLTWPPSGGIIEILTKDEVKGTMVVDYFDVRDLTVQIRDFLTEDLNLVPSNFTPPEPPDLPDPEPIYSAEQMVELIQGTIGTEETWAESAPEVRNNIIIIRNTPEIIAQVHELLRQLRASTGILVNLEVRFLSAEDNFLRDVGVDTRGLGEGVAPVETQGQGPPEVMDDVFFGTSAFGNPEPSSVGSSNDAGVFYNDGGDGAYSARVENLFDVSERTFGNPEVLTNSGGLSFQHTWLDDTAVEVILRAVEKTQRVQEITAPRITVYNAQRANVSVLNQVSYVADYEVEIAQASNIADPVVQTIQEGVVLDVRPIVSSDFRFVTLELRPTVAEVLRPIPTITTNLASGPFASAPVTLQVPELRIQRVRTTVMMPDGATLLLGGMKFYEKDVRESGVPLLSKIPVLSFLVTRKGNFVNRRNLLILVTVKIVSLEELEPKDNLVLPPEPERTFRPIREITPDCGPCLDGSCSVPSAATCAKPQPCSTCSTCRAR